MVGRTSLGPICRLLTWGQGGGAEGVYLIVDSTTIFNLCYNLQSAQKTTIYRQNFAKIYNFCSKTKHAVYKSTRFYRELFSVYNEFSTESTVSQPPPLPPKLCLQCLQCLRAVQTLRSDQFY